MKKRTIKVVIALIAVVAMVSAMATVAFAAVYRGTFTRGGVTGNYFASLTCTTESATAILNISNFYGTVQSSNVAYLVGEMYGTSPEGVVRMINAFSRKWTDTPNSGAYSCTGTAKNDKSDYTNIYATADFGINGIAFKSATVYAN